MNTVIVDAVRGVTVGEAQLLRNLSVFPILSEGNAGPAYITLGTALRGGNLRVEEVSEAGRVPELCVTNTGDMPVLILDGEELSGAKQNRVLNATVLLASQSKTTVHVSCTEIGRWSYGTRESGDPNATREFKDSELVMASKIRAGKNLSVAAALKQNQSFRSDQGGIWENIDRLSQSEGVQSRTGAMRDIFEEKRQDINDFMKAFPLQKHQVGLAFLIDRAVVGIDLVSRTDAYAELHDKLLRSYLIDSMPRNVEGMRCPTPATVEAFIDQILGCAESSFPSVGLGIDLRLESQEVSGSALSYDETCIHAAFFSTIAFTENPTMRGFRQRREFRQEGDAQEMRE